ncbi:MAG: aminoacyl-tRNA hydrolase [Acidobacteria bacterium]|nr:aminoacyl-tRNA hydrolase [Acidobacteriota bacterium]
MKLILGLGNPGPEYVFTRHNAGFLVLDALAQDLALKFKSWEGSSLTLATTLFGQRVLLAKPQTYMNLSGRAAADLSLRHGLGPKDLIIIYDDLDLPFGRIRIRERGGSAGHRGIESIIQHLGSQELTRIRLGIREDEQISDPVAYVLAKFPRQRMLELEAMIHRAIQALEVLLREGAAKAMSLFNATT